MHCVATDVAWSACVCMSMSVGHNRAKTAEPIEITLWILSTFVHI